MCWFGDHIYQRLTELQCAFPNIAWCLTYFMRQRWKSFHPFSFCNNMNSFGNESSDFCFVRRIYMNFGEGTHTQQYSGFIRDSVLRNRSWQCTKNHMQCPGSMHEIGCMQDKWCNPCSLSSLKVRYFSAVELQAYNLT